MPWRKHVQPHHVDKLEAEHANQLLKSIAPGALFAVGCAIFKLRLNPKEKEQFDQACRAMSHTQLPFHSHVRAIKDYVGDLCVELDERTGHNARNGAIWMDHKIHDIERRFGR
jgi:hypothetical protein